jgi:hypothetical protein
MSQSNQNSINPNFLLATFSVVVGMVGGYLIAILPLRSLAQSFVRTESMSAVLLNASKSEVLTTYLDPEQTEGAFDQIKWSAPQTISPFVGNAPQPISSDRLVINSLQLRASHEMAIPKPMGVFRVFITGGSAAFSSGAPDNASSIGGLLESMLNQKSSESGKRFEVFTAANVAWSTTQERIFIENRISEWQPDFVISLSGANDCHWGLRGRDILWYESYSDLFFREFINRTYSASGLSRLPSSVKVSDVSVPVETVAARLKKNVTLSAAALGKTPLVYALQPVMAMSSKALSAREKARPLGFSPNEKVLPGWSPAKGYFQSCFSAIETNLASSGIPNLSFQNLNSVFDSLLESDEIFIDNYHFGDRGNTLIARALMQEVL